MRPIYKSVVLESAILSVSLSLQAEINDGSDVTTAGVDASTLDGLRVELVAPNVSGARDLIKSGECTLDGSKLTIVLAANDWLRGGVYRLQVSATFGTQTMVIYSLDVTVPRYDALGDEPQEYEDTVTIVSTYGDGDKSGADATVYAKDADGNAYITKPLAVIGSVREGDGTTASGVASHAEGSGTTASGEGSHAEGNGTTASGEGSHAEGYGAIANGEGSHAEGNGTSNGDYSHTEGYFTTASGGKSHAEGDNTTASGVNSHAEGGGTTADGECSHAEGYATYATGDNSHAGGEGTIASQINQHVCGQFNVEDSNNAFLFIVGNGADGENRHNAFAVTRSGGLALFKADGTPVILDVAKLEALIASVS